MGIFSVVIVWCLYRYTELLASVPLARGLDWLFDKCSAVVRQPWAAGVTGVVALAAIPAVLCAMLLNFGFFISWPLTVVVVLLCMGPLRLHSMLVSAESDETLQSTLTSERFHRLVARDVVGVLVWAALLGAPGAIFFRAIRELAESPVATLVDQAEVVDSAASVFGILYWLPARVYALAQVVSGSGGALERLVSFEYAIADSDKVVEQACGDQTLAVDNASKAVWFSVVALSAINLLF